MEHLRENQPFERNNDNININQLGQINNELNNIQNDDNLNNMNDNQNGNNLNNNQNNDNINNNLNQNNNNNNEEQNENNDYNEQGGFNFANFNLNNLNYNRFRHVLHTYENEFLLNQKYPKNLWEILCTLTFTKTCHKASLYIFYCLLLCIGYILFFMNYEGSSLITKLESEDSYFEVIIWMINIIIIIIIWNFHLFLYISIFKYTYENNVNSIRTSFVEEVYKNPIGFILILYYIDNNNFKNIIDDSFWVLLGVQYWIIFFNLKHFFSQFYKELINITDFTDKKHKLLKLKVHFVSLFFLIEAIALIIFNYFIIQAMDIFNKFIFFSKGIYLLYKIYEIWKIFLDEYKFSESNMDIKEKIFYTNFRRKSLLELGSIIFIFFQFLSSILIGDSAPFYFNIIFCFLVIALGHHIFIYIKKYRELREYFKSLDEYIEKTKIDGDVECVICTEKMTNCRKLNCNHYFHLICLSKWFENGHNSCPICRTEINFNEKMKNIIQNRIRAENNNNNNNNGQGNNNNGFINFNINSNLFSWLPNNSLRIIRFINNNENDNNNIRNNVNIIVNNPNINRININIQRGINNNNNNQRQEQNQ